jgi:hypothetical protein
MPDFKPRLFRTKAPKQAETPPCPDPSRFSELIHTQIPHYTHGEWQSVHDIHSCLQGLQKLLNINLAPPLLSHADLDQIHINGLPPSTWTSTRHFGPAQRNIGSLHALSICGAWHNGANHFVVFFLCPKFWTIIDPLHKLNTPTSTMSTIIETALATTFLYHNLPDPLLPPLRRFNRIKIQNNFPLAHQSCGTIAILTTVHLTLGHIRLDNIHTVNISRRQCLTFQNLSCISSYKVHPQTCGILVASTLS